MEKTHTQVLVNTISDSYNVICLSLFYVSTDSINNNEITVTRLITTHVIRNRAPNVFKKLAILSYFKLLIQAVDAFHTGSRND